MARAIVLDSVNLTQVILMRDPVTGKVLVRATYQVKAGGEVAKTVADRELTFTWAGGAALRPDAMTTQEQAYAAAAWEVVSAAIQRLEL